jgi:hypothetical protein
MLAFEAAHKAHGSAADASMHQFDAQYTTVQVELQLLF